MATIGRVKDMSLEMECEFEWVIENFSLISTPDNECYYSEYFNFAGENWYLILCPNGDTENNSLGYIDLYLCRDYSDESTSLEFFLVAKTMNDTTDILEHYSFVFTEDECYGSVKFVKRSELLQIIPNDVLTIICSMKLVEFRESNNAEAAKCLYCNRILDAEVISSHEKRCLNKRIKCPECNDNINIRVWCEHVCEMEKEKVIERMLDYFKDVMVNGEHSDTTIQVGETQFKLHRAILAARNPFFNAMFSSDMKEKATGFVSLQDCEPNIFDQFVQFLYTGKIEDLSEENVCRLYEIADKYQDDQLKEKCLHFMRTEITVENFFDFIALALKFDNKKLLEKAVDFFSVRIKEIIRHVKWQNFLKEYPTQANELLITFFDNYVK